jgi:hypothetical protein
MANRTSQMYYYWYIVLDMHQNMFIYFFKIEIISSISNFRCFYYEKVTRLQEYTQTTHSLKKIINMYIDGGLHNIWDPKINFDHLALF